jgi:hypothetical protein
MAVPGEPVLHGAVSVGALPRMKGLQQRCRNRYPLAAGCVSMRIRSIDSAPADQRFGSARHHLAHTVSAPVAPVTRRLIIVATEQTTASLSP